jgi:hypothetical protein
MTTGDFHIGDVQINQFGSDSIGQQFISNEPQGDPLDRLPDDAMSEFVRAVAQSLTALELSRAGLEDARRTIDEIRGEAAKGQPERRRLRQLAATLRNILEEASGHALGAILLGTWHP